jgi:maleylpyruvate isomerase
MTEHDVRATVELSTDLLLATVDGMTAAQLREPSRLPDWTRAHLLNHLAGAPEAQAGARRSVAELSADLRAAADRLERELDAAANGSDPGSEVARPQLLGRLRELEVHHVDLDLGYRFDDVPEWVAAWLVGDIVATFAARDEPLAVRISATDAGLERELGQGGPLVRGSVADLLGWLSGRTDGVGLSVEVDAAEGVEGVEAEGAGLPGVPAWI